MLVEVSASLAGQAKDGVRVALRRNQDRDVSDSKSRTLTLCGGWVAEPHLVDKKVPDGERLPLLAEGLEPSTQQWHTNDFS